MNEVFDTHAHLDQVEDLEACLDLARKAGVVGVIAVGTEASSNEKTLRIAERFKGFVHPALGLHPCDIVGFDSARIAQELKFIEDNIGIACAVGEIGLDYHKRTLADVPKALQSEVLGEVLSLAKRHRKPVLVHSRYAWTDAFRLVADAGMPIAVFHWFTGFAGVLRGIMDAGYYVSATPAVEYHEEHRRAVRAVSSERLLLETDTPVWYGRAERYRSSPLDVLRSLRAVAELRDEHEDTVAAYTTRGARLVLGEGVSPDIEEVE
ncbi:MAG: TatD family hydrolase [Dehalococcoidia bacterium]|nr:TatD family hydrolase [Dehalococcoidia bacterium]